MELLNRAIRVLSEEGVSCVVLRDKETFTATGVGVKPLMGFLRKDRRFFQDAVVADKVIGKAAAMLLIAGGAQAVYGAVMSDTAVEILTKNCVVCDWGERVPYIKNRTNTGICPLEDAVKALDDPAAAFPVLEIRIAELMAQK